MAYEHFPDGIKIGPDGTGSERLPLYDFDEWAVGPVDLGVIAAGEVKILTFNDISTVRAGAKIMACPLNPGASEYNADKYIIMHCWCSGEAEIKVMVKNVHNDEVDFSNFQDQWIISFWNTNTP